MRGVGIGAIRAQCVANWGNQNAAIAATNQDIERRACQQISDLPRAYYSVCNRWSEGSGIPPGNAIALLDARTGGGADPTLPGLKCLRELWTSQGPDAERVRQGIAGLRTAPPRRGLPVILVHGIDDGLVPLAFTSAPYVAAARAAGRTNVRLWQVPHAQHFDALLGAPTYATQYVPLLPYVYAALDHAWAYLDGVAALPADSTISSMPRAVQQPLTPRHLAIPEAPGVTGTK